MTTLRGSHRFRNHLQHRDRVAEPADDESDIGNSGLHDDNGLILVKAERRTASGTQCITRIHGFWY